ncbi:MAG TPA: TetR/AcrR family transcriptional regulator [Solirubrobacteraceae bacterium]|jgi:AcrR family transcriptional regulator|nr:TetR/AcrR family transcriptional regulator [Solirubrobacteraceae bacterium]
MSAEQTTETERPVRADARRNRMRILEAARELFSHERPDVQMDDVARLAGVGVGTVYRHFRDKHALMGALVRERFAEFDERLREAVDADAPDPFAALCEVLRTNAASLSEDAATRYALMSGGERAFAYAIEEAEEFMRLSEILVGRARAAGSLRVDFDAEEIPMIMCGVCSTMDPGKPDWDWRRYLELILDGMRARA